MTYLQAIILGLVQGATEFIPISSSGHLVLVPYYLGWELPDRQAFLFDVISQVATLAAVVTFFWKDLRAIVGAVVRGLLERQPFHDPFARLGWYLVIASIPAGVFGLMFRDSIERAFANPAATAWFLLGTAALLVVAERVGKRVYPLDHLTWRDALWIGIFQVLALYPGISRSGATITGGMSRGLQRPAAARFSFLMAVPIMLAAGLSAGLDLLQTPDLSTSLLPMLVGFLTAAIVGYLSIRWLLGFLARRPVTYFAIYCALAGLTTLLVMNV